MKSLTAHSSVFMAEPHSILSLPLVFGKMIIGTMLQYLYNDLV